MGLLGGGLAVWQEEGCWVELGWPSFSGRAEMRALGLLEGVTRALRGGSCLDFGVLYLSQVQWHISSGTARDHRPPFSPLYSHALLVVLSWGRGCYSMGCGRCLLMLELYLGDRVQRS